MSSDLIKNKQGLLDDEPRPGNDGVIIQREFLLGMDGEDFSRFQLKVATSIVRYERAARVEAEDRVDDLYIGFMDLEKLFRALGLRVCVLAVCLKEGQKSHPPYGPHSVQDSLEQGVFESVEEALEVADELWNEIEGKTSKLGSEKEKWKKMIFAYKETATEVEG